MKGKQIGYVRVSSADQNTERQLDGIALDKVFTDKCSGKDTHRPQLALALDYVREGDTLVVHSMDRLARSVDDLRRIVKTLTTDGIAAKFVKENLTFTGDDSPMNNLLLTLLGAVAEFERSMIHERQREGIAIAKAKGLYKGRKQQLTEQEAAELKARVERGDQKAQIARDLGISRNSLYNYLDRLQ
ncbi:Site-specific DNA recombinase [Collimonas sp. OK307]|uniref:recombinase family protein n=1 Tax=Collimonas sp. OK307 TaxID=1801620 RepID=UPI0008EEC721|nr:recombinase family protein [Collimonas sp. OK307]SFH74767.1 Site-specific DNA recombinase [Collimonas sp. OK307]